MSTFCGLLGEPLRPPGTFGAGRTMLVLPGMRLPPGKKPRGEFEPWLGLSFAVSNQNELSGCLKIRGSEGEKMKQLQRRGRRFQSLTGLTRCCHLGKRRGRKFGKSWGRRALVLQALLSWAAPHPYPIQGEQECPLSVQCGGRCSLFGDHMMFPYGDNQNDLRWQ